MLASEKHKSTYLAPIGIGLALFVAELVGVFFTGGSLNPARSFGPCVVTRDFPGYHYIYWFGPLMGTLLAWGMYRIVKLAEYQTINPGQDFDDHEVCLSLRRFCNLILIILRRPSSNHRRTPLQQARSNALTPPLTRRKKRCTVGAQPGSNILGKGTI
jgi:hypothetical protein